MQITSKELDHVAAAEAPRVDMYTGIHKAMRACMVDTLCALGRADVSDEADLAQACERVLGLMALCGSHLAHENAFVHAAIDARAPGASDAVAHDHEEHEKHIASLTALTGLLQRAPVDQRPAHAARLYSALALFIADNFHHMDVEETAHNAVLWARYTDAELIAIHDALVASIPPQEMMIVARWLVPSMNPTERAHLLADIRGKAPAPAFQAILDTVRPYLTAHEWGKLARALELAAA